MDLKKILVPIDGSKQSFQSLDRALTLAGFTHGHVTCLHVIPHVMPGVPRTKMFDKQLQDEGKIVLKKQQHAQETKMSNSPQNFLEVHLVKSQYNWRTLVNLIIL